MGRGRRGARSSDDEDDGVSSAPRGVLSSQVSGGGRAGKKWQPGMSGSQQKARAKEQRLEQERRKAERERRNEDKRAERDRLHESEAHRDTPPKSAGKHRRGRVDEGSSSLAVGTPVHGQGQHATHHLDAARVRRELRRLFGRVEHGGGISPLSGRVVHVDDVVVVLLEAAVEERRKSGAGAWSQRLQKGGERDVPLSTFLAMNGARDAAGSAAGSPSVYSSSPTSGLGSGFSGTVASAPEPPYHLVLRVVARWQSPDDNLDLDRHDDDDDLDADSVEEETLWTNHQGGPDAMAIVDDLGEMRLGGSPGGPGSRARSDAFPGVASTGRRRDRDAFSLLPRHCWEDVASLCDPKSLARLAATCAGLAAVVRSTTVRRAAHARVFGKPPPAASDFREGRVGAARVASGAAPPPPLSPAAAEELGARRGWAATCASAIAADAWIPREIDRAAEDASEDEASDRDADDDAAFDADDADFARERDTRPAREPELVVGDEEDEEEIEGDCGVTWFARDSAPRAPSPKYSGVGPHSAIRMLANAATAVSCDGAKIKLWFHGGDGQTEAGKRIATLPNPAGSRPWTSLAAGPGVFLAGDDAGRVTAWDADTLEARVSRLPGVVAIRQGPGGDETQNLAAPVAALAVVPSSGVAAASGAGTSVVRLFDVDAERAGATRGDVNLNGVGDRDGNRDGNLDGNRDGTRDGNTNNLDDVRDVDDLVVTGVAEGYRDSTGTRVFAPRGGRAGFGAPRLWAATRRGDGGAALVAVDLETATVTHRVDAGERFPGAGLDLAETRDDAWSPRRLALAAHGDLLVLARGGAATMWDARICSAALGDPVARFGGGIGDSREWGPPARARRAAHCVAVDDWSVWLSHEGCPGVRLFDARRASGPPRGAERWHVGEALRIPPVALYRPGSYGGASAGTGCFARGGDGTLVVAPAAGERREESARCCVYTSAHHGEDDESGGEDDGFAKAKGGKKKKDPSKKVKRKYPKRQGGKFRARTAGG